VNALYSHVPLGQRLRGSGSLIDWRLMRRAHTAGHRPQSAATEGALRASPRTLYHIYALAALMGCVYWVLRALEQTGDSLSYAWSAKTGHELFHPHHLLYSPIVRLLHRLLTWTSVSSDTLLAMQLHNTVWACVAVVAVYLLGRVGRLSPVAATLASWLLATSNGVMTYATQAEVYVPTAACLAILSYLLLRPSQDRWTPTGMAWLCLWFVLAIGYHQTSVLFVAPLLFVALLRREPGELRGATAVVVVTGLVSLAAYVFAYLATAGRGGLSGFVRYCLLYAVSDTPAWGTCDNINAVGLARLLKSQLTCMVSMPAGASPPVLLLTGLFGLLLVGVIAQAIRLWIQERADRSTLLLMLAWIAAFGGFFLWWLPGEEEFFIGTEIPILILMVAGTAHLQWQFRRRAVQQASAVLVVALGVLMMAHNLSASVLPRHRTRGPAYARARDIAALWGQGCSVATGNPEIQNLRYHYGIDGGVEIGRPLMQCYATGRAPQGRLRTPGNCLILDLTDIRPDRFSNPSGFERPREWSLFIRWLFEAEPLDSAGGFTALSMEPAGGSNESALLYLPGQRQRYSSWRDFLARVDGLDTRGPGSRRGVFSEWLKSVPATSATGE
jgi:hypothetical protein